MVFQGSAKHEGPVAGWHLIGLAREVQKEVELVFPRSKEVKNILQPCCLVLGCLVLALLNHFYPRIDFWMSFI